MCIRDRDNGSITFNFDPIVGVTHIEFSLDGGSTWSGDIAIDSGSWTQSDLGPGSYDLMIRNGNDLCPIDIDDVILVDQPSPIVDAGADLEVCAGDDVQIDATVTEGTAPLTYAWTGPAGFTANTEDITANLDGVYNLIVTDANNCTAEDEVMVTVLIALPGQIVAPTLECPANDPGLISSCLLYTSPSPRDRG